MKQEIKTYKIVCDSCGETFHNADDFCCYADDRDGQLIESEAANSDWMKLADRHYCPDCWDRDDDDNILTRDGRKYTDDGEEMTV